MAAADSPFDVPTNETTRDERGEAMSHFCTGRHLLRAGDRIHDELDALGVVSMALAPEPGIGETIALVLDHDRRSREIVIVNDTPGGDDLIGVVEWLCAAVRSGARPDVGGYVVASVRPRQPVEPDDVDRWCEASELCAAAGVELVEWFVISGHRAADVSCPRDLIGEPPRWRRR